MVSVVVGLRVVASMMMFFCGGFDNVGRVTKVRVLGDLLVLCGVVMVSFTVLWGLSGGSKERWWLF